MIAFSFHIVEKSPSGPLDIRGADRLQKSIEITVQRICTISQAGLCCRADLNGFTLNIDFPCKTFSIGQSIIVDLILMKQLLFRIFSGGNIPANHENSFFPFNPIAGILPAVQPLFILLTLQVHSNGFSRLSFLI